MNSVDHTKTKQHLIDFSRWSITTDNIILATQYARKYAYLAPNEKLTPLGSTVASYLDFNWELMDRINYGS